MDAAQNGDGKAFLSTGEVGKLLGVSSYWVNCLIAKGELDTHRIADRGWHRVSRRSLNEYARRHRLTLDWKLIQ